jgi:hypothetical protein
MRARKALQLLKAWGSIRVAELWPAGLEIAGTSIGAAGRRAPLGRPSVLNGEGKLPSRPRLRAADRCWGRRTSTRFYFESESN